MSNTNNFRASTKVYMLASIIIILGLTPIGFIQTPFFNITMVHVPVIIGGLLLGPKNGAILGFVFGLTSFINAHIRTTPTSLFFSPLISGNLMSLLVCFFPRIMTGFTPTFFLKIFKKLNRVGLFLTGVCSSFVNTFFVIFFIYIFFKDEYINAFSGKYTSILGIFFANIFINSVVEAITAGIFTVSAYNSLKKSNKNL